MIVSVKKVNKNFGKDGKICHEAWVYGRLKSGVDIEIFDPDCRIPKSLENHSIEILISIYGLQEKKKEKIGYFRGKYLGIIKIPEKWLKLDPHLKSYHLEGNYAIQTQDGIFIVDEIKKKIGKKIIFTGLRFDLYAWHPIQD